VNTFTLVPQENSPAPPRVFQAMETAKMNQSRRMVPLFVPRRQLYYWSQKWQEGEREALRELAEGKGRTFADGSSAAAWLLGDED